jgi:outer membrane protein OmpA-like peptidoglycan-associated protein/LysM repeat protein
VVQAGDDLWSLAEQYYGDGREWRKIAAANPTVLTGGPDRLQVGWRLRIPDLDHDLPAGDRVITVRRGDTLSSIAERELGSSARWDDIFQVNRAQLGDPDELAVGTRLVLPEPKEKPAARTRSKSPDQQNRPEPAPTERQRSASPAQPSVSPAQPSVSPAEPTAGGTSTETTDQERTLDVSAVTLAGVGGLLAAGVIGGLAVRRRIQLQTRQPGRRIVHPPAATHPVEVALGRRQQPMSLRTLDRAMRAIAAHCRDSATAPPPLQLALIGETEIELRMHEAWPAAPVGFTVHGRSWFLAQEDVGYLKSVPGLGEAARPWPALVTLGRDDQDRLVLGDLEAFGLLAIQRDSGFAAIDLLAAMAVELSFSPWADEMIITLVGGGDRLPAALGKHNVIRTDDVDPLLDRLEHRAAMQHQHRRYEMLSQHRIDLDLADPWAPEVVLVQQPLSTAQNTRLRALTDAEPKVTVAAVVVGAVAAAWSLRGDGSSAERRVVLEPAGLSLSPQWLEPPELTAVVDLIETTGSEDTTPAPWWSEVEVQPDPPPDNVTYLESRLTTWGTANTEERALIMEAAMDPGRTVHHPTLQLLGPIELFGAILTSSNRNERPPEPDRRDPELIKSFGDLILGGKAVVPVRRGFTAGAELGFRFLSSISDLSFSPSSTSLWIGPVATVDFRPLTGAPIRVHANANFYLDNSANLYDFANTSIYTREVAMFAYGIAASRLRFGLGVDAPLERLTAPVPLQPFVAYHAEVVTASADPAFAGITGDPGNRDQHWLTFGIRARVYRGLTLDAGVDIGLRSVGYEYGPPVPPYDVIFGVSYPLDVAAFSKPVVVTRTIEKVPPPTMGTIVGTVKNKADGKPVSEAVVSFVGQPRARVATDPDGSFQSVPLPPGPAEVAVTAAGFEPATGKATVVAGSSATVEVALVAKISNGNVRGKVSDRAGKGVVATLRFIGATTFESRADGTGAFSAALPAGPYRVVVDVTGLPSKEVPLDIVAGQDRQLDVTMRASNPDVTLTPQAIVLRVPIRFKAGAPKLAPGIKAELEGVVDLLAEHPEIKMLRVEAHWSGGGRKGKGTKGDPSKQLTERQAKAVRDFLISKGAPADRIEAVGVGGDVPLVPNIGPGNQAKKRRVEMVVVR